MAGSFFRASVGLLAALLLWAGAAPASANVIGIESFMGHPDLAYTGDIEIRGKDGTVQGKVYRAPSLLRTDFTMNGVPFGSLIDLTRDLAVLWSPTYRAYATTPVTEVGVRDWVPLLENHSQVTLVSSGEAAQEVNGVMATRYELSGVSPDGTAYTGQLWAAEDGIVVRLVARIATVDGPITYNLTNLRVGPQSPSLFGVPSGYQKYSWNEAAALLGF